MPPSCTPLWDVTDEDETLAGSSSGGAPVALRGDGTLVSAHSTTVASVVDVRLRAWSADGALLWEAIHSLGDLRDTPYALVADASGDVYLAASSNATTDSRAAVVKLSGQDGAIVWHYERDGMAGSGLDRAVKLGFDGGGRLLAALEINDEAAGSDVVVVALDPSDGAEQSSASWSALESNGASVGGMVIDPDTDAVHVIGSRSTGTMQYQPFLLGFEPTQTTPSLAVDVHDDGTPDFELGVDLTWTVAGELVALLTTDDEGDFGFVLLGLDPATGAVTWERPGTDYGMGVGPAMVFSQALIGLPDGGLALAGWGQGLSVTSQEAFLLRLDEDRELGCLGLRDEGNLGPLFTDLVATDAGRVYVGGYVYSGQFRTLVSAWGD